MIVAAALTHDLGIVYDQQEIHRKKQQLNDSQLNLIHSHPTHGESLLKQFGVDDEQWLDAVRHHHERLDGSGYPDGLTEAELSTAAKVLAIADSYAAIVHPTEFREENSGKQALSILYQARDKTMDKHMVELFIEQVGVYPPGSLVELKNGMYAVVVERGEKSHQPKVRAVMSPDRVIYKHPRLLPTDTADYQIVREHSLLHNRLLLQSIESIWQ